MRANSIALIAALTLILGGCGSKADEASTQSTDSSLNQTISKEDALMDTIERLIQLPSNARPLNSYHRYYSWSDNKTKVKALFLSGQAPGRSWTARSEFPSPVMDGGCGVIFLEFDVATNLIELGCNGEA
jgi:hypothetical protein